MSGLDIKTSVRLQKNLLSGLKGAGDLDLLVQADVLIFLPQEQRAAKLRQIVEGHSLLKRVS